MCDFCITNRRDGEKYCIACGKQVNETMENESGCEKCKCLDECEKKGVKCPHRVKIAKDERISDAQCIRIMNRKYFCPNCGKKTFIYISRIKPLIK